MKKLILLAAVCAAVAWVLVPASSVTVLADSESAVVTAGVVYDNSDCLDAGDCDAYNYTIVFTCPNPPSNFCSSCRLDEDGDGNPSLTPNDVNGCKSNQPNKQCEYKASLQECGDRWLGTCSGSVCGSWSTYDLACQAPAQCGAP